MDRTIKDCTRLNNGLEMPWLGIGLYKVKAGQEVERVVKYALEVGYRSIDTASFYNNESGVGKAMSESGIPREDVFLITKVWNDDLRERRTLAAFEESLERLGTDYVDLYLIHWPVKGFYEEAWLVMEEIYRSGLAKAIGVSNFLEHHLEDILRIGSVVPTLNQVEFHPYLVQPGLLNFCKRHNIQLQARNPLMHGQIITDPTVHKLAEKYHKTPAQVVLRWDLQHGVGTIPKSVHPERIKENSEIFDFELSQSDMKVLDGLDAGKRLGSHPDHFTH